MKANKERWVVKYSSTLYIPHGSDERCHSVALKTTVAQLYIPHGSDES